MSTPFAAQFDTGKELWDCDAPHRGRQSRLQATESLK